MKQFFALNSGLVTNLFWHRHAHSSVMRLLASTALAVACSLSAARADVFSNVPEAAGWRVAYTLPLPNANISLAVPYSVDNSWNIVDGSFTRIGYYLELDNGTGLKWVYVSFDAAPFSLSARMIGVPIAATGEFYHYDAAGLLPGQVRNMNVLSNVGGIINGTTITTGNVEFWPSNYNQSNQWGVPGANGSTFDFGDGGANGTSAGHGSMQIHNYGAGQTLFAINGFNQVLKLGIGNQPVNDPDWTFNSNAASYAVKNLQVVVQLVANTSWNGNFGNDWATAANWSSGVPDAAGAYAIVGEQTGSSIVDLVSAGRTVGYLDFRPNASTTVQSTGGNTLTFDNSGSAAAIVVGGAHSLTAPVALNSDLIVQGTGTLTMSGNTTANGRAITIKGPQLLALTGGSTLSGAGTLITQTGGALSIANATVTMASNANGVFGVGYGATGTGTVTVGSGGVLNIGTGGGRTFIGGGPSGGTMGTGVLNINAGGTVTVAAPGLFPNEALYLAGYGGTGTISFNGGVLATARGISTGGTGGITLQSGGGTIDDLGSAITIISNVPIGGNGTLTKTGSGTLTLGNSTSMVNTFAGTLNINAGTLRVAGGNNNNNHFTGNPNINVNNGGTLAFNAYNTFGLNTASMSAVTINAGGTVVSSGDGANHVTVFNNLKLNSGTAIINCNDGFGGSWGSFGFGGTTTATGTSAISLAAGFTGTIQNGNGNAGFGTFTITTPAATDSLTIAPTVASSLALVKNGSGAVTLTGANTYTGTTTVNGGTLTFAPSSGSNTIGPVNVNGGAAGAVLNVNGPTNLGGNNMSVATAAADRSVAILNGNLVTYSGVNTSAQLLAGNGAGTAGAVIQNGGSVSINTGVGGGNVVSLGVNSGYGYYQMNGGTLTTGQLAAGGSGGSGNVGVFDMNGGYVNVNAGNGWLLAGGWTTNSKGEFNLYGGTMVGPSGNPVSLSIFNNNNAIGRINMLGSTAVLIATANANGLNMVGNNANGNNTGVVNLNAGTLVARRVYQAVGGSAQFNFNGGTLQAMSGGANVTMALNTGGSAYIYSGGANLDSADSNLTISQPLLAPTGYGATSVAINNGGAGYIGTPFVVLSGGSGVGATAVAQVNFATGAITNILITSHGSGYGAGDVLTATLSGGGATTPATLGAVTLGANTSGGLTKSGSGTLTLSPTAASTLTGPITATAGTLILGPGGNNANWLTGKPDIIIQSGATLSFAGYNVFGNALAGMSAVTLNNSTMLSSPDGANRVTVLNNLTINNGTVTVTGNDGYTAAWGTWGFGGTTTATGSSVINTLPGKTGTIGNGNNFSPVFTVNTPAPTDTLEISTVMQSSGGTPLSLMKQGAGTLRLTAANTYSGGTTVSQGTLEVANASLAAANPLGTGPVTLAGGTLKLSGQMALVNLTEQPRTMTGWNNDFIWAVSEPTAPGGTSYTLNDWVYYEEDASRNGGVNGLPVSRTFASAANPAVTFQIEPYNSLNTLLTTTTPTTLTLASPGQFASLHFLDAKGNAAVTMTYTLNFADSTTTTGTYTVRDWTQPNAITTSLARRSTSGGSYFQNAGLSQTDISLSTADQAKVLNSITFSAAGGGGSWVMGVSGTSGTTGYAATQTYGNAVQVTADSTIDVRNSPDAALGPLSIGSQTLNITGDSGASVTVGSTTLSGNPTFNTAADTTLKVGAISDGGAGHGITKAGTGTMTMSGHSTYGGSTIISGGTLRLTGATTNLGNIMPLGDSITYGSLSTDAGYRSALYSLLNADGYGFQFVGSLNNYPGATTTLPVGQRNHEGHSGWNVAQVLNGVTPTAQGGLGWLSVDPDLITLMIGTNNRGGGVAGVPTAISQLGQIIDTISLNAPGAAMFVAEITPIPSPYDTFVAAYNASLISLVNSKHAGGANVYLVDLNTGYPTPLSTTLPDNLHPSDLGYAWMGQQWYDAIVASLGTSLPATTAVSIASGATLDLNGVNQTVASLSDHAGGGGQIVNGASATPLTLTINPVSGTTTFSGTINDNGSANAISVVKSGAGTQVLSGVNNYSGATTITAGTLLLAGSGEINSSSGVVINGGAFIQNSSTSFSAPLSFGPNGGTVGGSGTVIASLSISANSIISPGNSPGTQTYVGTQTWLPGGTYLWEINDALGTAGSDPGWDLVNIEGTLDLTALSPSGLFTIDIQGLALSNFNSHASYAFPILDATTITGFDSNAFTFATVGTPGYASWSITSAGSTLWLQYTSVVPEPTVVGLLGLGGLLLLVGRRMRRR